MQPALSFLRQHARWYAAAGALAVFAAITARYLVDSDSVVAFDDNVLLGLADLRQSWLNGVAVDVTALGSVTLIIFGTAIGLAGFGVVRDRAAQLQLLLSTTGGLLWAAVTKNLVERARPDVVDPLVAVSTFSYPSGHSLSSSALYMTMALLLIRHVSSHAGRVAVMVTAIAVALLVGVSRMYLGVHYPSDVAGGITLGFAWALLLGAIFTVAERRARIAPQAAV
jgi:undecaprenyl-diphosphatase